jgi:hypothetical protein
MSPGLPLEPPDPTSLRPVLRAIAAAFVMTFRLRWSVPRTLLVCPGLSPTDALGGLPVSYQTPVQLGEDPADLGLDRLLGNH